MAREPWRKWPGCDELDKPPYVEPKEKACTRCKEVQPAIEFYLKERTTSGTHYPGKRRNICRGCEKRGRKKQEWKPRHPIDRRTRAYLATPEGQAHAARRLANFQEALYTL